MGQGSDEVITSWDERVSRASPIIKLKGAGNRKIVEKNSDVSLVDQHK
jgi:hypothetical protein